MAENMSGLGSAEQGAGRLWEVGVPLFLYAGSERNEPVDMYTLTVSPKMLFCNSQTPCQVGRGDEVTLQYGPSMNGERRAEHNFQAEVVLKYGETPWMYQMRVLPPAPGFLHAPQMVGRDAVFLDTKHRALQMAPYNVSLLLLGESGTGKSLLAEVIHQFSPRSEQPLVRLNCPSLPESLIESELFGHEKGAFTGATTKKPGLFKVASGGTLVLEEISVLPASVQAKLLQAIEEKSFRTVGGKDLETTDVRIIATSNDDIETMVEERKFRLDLFYRLNEMALYLPPLRERPTDIPLLYETFRILYCSEFGRQLRPLSGGMRDRYCEYSWPGNIRELDHMAKLNVLTGEELMPGRSTLPRSPAASVSGDKGEGHSGLFNRIEGVERATLQEALGSTDTKTRAAAKLGISYRTLLRKIKKYGL
ncbi:MAG: sigma 54-interacting transcriptional regulator [Planctomycetota bacterium]